MAAGIVFRDGQSCRVKKRHVKYNSAAGAAAAAAPCGPPGPGGPPGGPPGPPGPPGGPPGPPGPPGGGAGGPAGGCTCSICCCWTLLLPPEFSFSPAISIGFIGVGGADSIKRDSLDEGGGVAALDRDGDAGADTPNSSNFLVCSDFCFLRRRSASISALLCSLACRLPALVAAPVGSEENHDIYWYFDRRLGTFLLEH